jgi:hypothetical protein
MHFYFLFPIVCLFSNMVANEPTPAHETKKEDSTTQIHPLANEDTFVVFYAFANQDLEAPLKKEMIKYLEKIGTVYSSDDGKLSDTQKKDKYKTGGMMINIVATPLVEENTPTDAYQELPVVELLLQVRSGVEILENGSKIPCTIWENEKFIGSISDKKAMNQKAIKAMSLILDSFIKDYQKANPSKQRKKPQFFLYS